jgi:4-oxalocrotonate tautomerase
VLVRPKQKREIVERLIETMVSIECENMWPVTWVIIEEVNSGEWSICGAIGGKPIATADVKALAANVAA